MRDISDKAYLGKLELKNRIIRAAVGDRTLSGNIERENLSLYQSLAEGGAGAILTGFTTADSKEREIAPIFSLGEDRFIGEHKRLTDLVRQRGARIFSQIVFIGSYTFPALHKEGREGLLAPSAVKRLGFDCTPREARPEEIRGVQEKLAAAALRAQKAGYDGVEIHAAHGFFLSQFMTPHYNRRSDSWGGSPENRGRMALETYRAVRSAVGADFPVLIKVNVQEDFEGGVVFDDVLRLASALAAEKADGIEISGSSWAAAPQEKGAFYLDEGAKIAESAGVKVILTGGLRSKEQMNKILNETKIEFFGLARPLMRDPAIPNKLLK